MILIKVIFLHCFRHSAPLSASILWAMSFTWSYLYESAMSSASTTTLFQRLEGLATEASIRRALKAQLLYYIYHAYGLRRTKVLIYLSSWSATAMRQDKSFHRISGQLKASINRFHIHK